MTVFLRFISSFGTPGGPRRLAWMGLVIGLLAASGYVAAQGDTQGDTQRDARGDAPGATQRDDTRGDSDGRSGPKELVEKATKEILARYDADREAIDASPQRLYALVDEVVLPHFDFRRMSRRALGKHWRRATPKQRRRFVSEFRTLLVRTYAIALRQYTGQALKYADPKKRKGRKEVSVRTEILRDDGASIPITYFMYPRNGQWKVYDVAVSGISLVVNYRSSFANEIRQGGMDSLIARLAERNGGGE